jgi:DNA-binding NarL/FixJ family response regulator
VIRVVVADDQQLVREGLRAILESAPDIAVAGLAADGVEAVAAVRRHRPEVVVMDVRMPKMDGIAATREICRLPASPRVLMLTTFDLDEHVYDALRAGASGFLLKDAPAGRLAEAVRLVAAGETLLDPAVTRRLVERFLEPALSPAAPSQVATLSERELEILRELARGRSNAEIAARLHVSPATVKTHVANVLHKLGVRDRVQAVVMAYEAGLVRPGEAVD